MFDTWNALVTLAVQASEKTAEVADSIATTAEEAAPAADAAADAAAAGGVMGPWLLLVGVFLVLVVPFVLGTLISGALRSREFATRIGVTLMAITLGISPFIVRYFNGTPPNEMVRLGIDLAGGTNMVFQVKPDEGKIITQNVMDKMVGAIGKRINPSGTEEIVVRPVGTDRIEVIVPGADPQTVDEIKKRITRLGTLEFYILANPTVETSIVQQAQELDPLTHDLTDAANKVIARWIPAYERNGVPVPLERSDAVRREVTRERTVDGRIEQYDTEEYLMLVDPEDQRVSGRFLTSATPGIDPETGGQLVSFRFNQTGAFRFGQLTGRYQPRDGRLYRALAIVLDGRVYSAPNINSVITSNGQITGDFTAAETKATFRRAECGSTGSSHRPETAQRSHDRPDSG